MQSSTGHRWTEDSFTQGFVADKHGRADLVARGNLGKFTVFSQNRAGIVKGSRSFLVHTHSRDTLSDSKSCNMLLEISKVVGMSPTIQLAPPPPPTQPIRARVMWRVFKTIDISVLLSEVLISLVGDSLASAVSKALQVQESPAKAEDHSQCGPCSVPVI